MKNLEVVLLTRSQKCQSVRLVNHLEQARSGQMSDDQIHMWGTGPETWYVYVAPGQTKDEAFLDAGLDPVKDQIVCWGEIYEN
jgi:hypothetical protein